MVNMIGIFDEESTMLGAVDMLKSSGMKIEKLSVINNDDFAENQLTDNSNIKRGFPDGGTIGGVAGLRLGMDAVVIPGLSPDRYYNDDTTQPSSSGLLISGGIHGNLESMFRFHGFTGEVADKLEHDLISGKQLLSFYIQDGDNNTAYELLKQNGAIDVEKLDKV